MTEASRQALALLRDGSQTSWYVIPLLAILLYVYGVEIERRNWSGVFAGLAFWGMDWINELLNSVILHATGHSALWTAPGRTAYLILVGLNVEICFMFAIAGVIVTKWLPRDRTLKILGLPNRFAIALGFSIFCVAVEVFLNRAGMLVWEYRFWNFPNLYLIVVFGYLHFFLVSYWVHDLPTVRAKTIAVGVIYGVAAVLAAVFGLGLRWL